MKTKKKNQLLDYLGRQLQVTTRYKRLGLFWTAAIVGLAVPWIPGCETRTQQACSVNSIYDGDTMRLTCNGERVKVRLYCIDAPEMRQRPWGKESRDYLRSITPEQVKIVAKTKDRYGRIVGELFAADEQHENLNLAMVRSGQAVVYPKYCKDQRYYEVEGDAKRIKSGVWEKQGLQQTPWRWRH